MPSPTGTLDSQLELELEQGGTTYEACKDYLPSSSNKTWNDDDPHYQDYLHNSRNKTWNDDDLHYLDYLHNSRNKTLNDDDLHYLVTELKKSFTDDVVELRCVDTECSTNQIFSERNPDVEVLKSFDVIRKSQELNKICTKSVVKLRRFETECSTNQIFSDEENDVADIKFLDVERKSQELNKSSTDDDVKLSTFDTECSTNQIFSDEENDVAVIKSPDVDRNSKELNKSSTDDVVKLNAFDTECSTNQIFSDVDRNSKGPLDSKRLSRLLCLVLNGIYNLFYDVNKRPAISFWLLVMVYMHVAGDSSPDDVCSVSSHLEGIPSGSLEVGKGMKLICRHNGSEGTPRWDQDKPIGRKLTYNENVLPRNKQKIYLEIIENEYNIIFLNATFADINSTYTCHYGFYSTHISPIDYYNVLPTDKSISKQSVYKNNVLNGTLEFEEVYPLPECVSYCDDKRQNEIPICKTCKIWKRNFYKVKIIFNIDLKNKICREENVSVRCAVRRNHFTYDFSKLRKRRKNNKERSGILIGIIICVIVLFGLFVLIYELYKCGASSRCWRDRNVETPGMQFTQTEQSPDHGNNSQNEWQENVILIQETSKKLIDTNNSNRQISEQCDSQENVSLNQEGALN